MIFRAIYDTQTGELLAELTLSESDAETQQELQTGQAEADRPPHVTSAQPWSYDAITETWSLE